MPPLTSSVASDVTWAYLLGGLLKNLSQQLNGCTTQNTGCGMGGSLAHYGPLSIQCGQGHTYTYYQAIRSAIRGTANNTTIPITRGHLRGGTQCVYQGNAQKTPETSGKTLITSQGFSVKNSFDIYRGG
jgi:hypothetical protein